MSPENLVLYYHCCVSPPPPADASATTSLSSSSGPPPKPGDAKKKPSLPSKTKQQKQDTATATGVADASGQAGDGAGNSDDFNAAKQGNGLSPMPLKPYYLDVRVVRSRVRACMRVTDIKTDAQLAGVLCRWASTGEFPISFVSMDGACCGTCTSDAIACMHCERGT
jgi:hypothetical protein